MPPDDRARADLASVGAENVSRETLAGLRLYLALLEKWQSAYNLVSKDALADIWERHVLDSAQLLPHLPAAGLVADFGSGAGLPGLLLALLGVRSGRRFLLVESNSKKAQFLAEVIRRTGAPATIETRRIEDLAPLSAAAVTARALAPLPKLLEYAAFHLAETGRALFLKGETADVELTDARRSWTFDAERLPSRTHSRGCVLILGTLRSRRDSDEIHGLDPR